GLTSGLVRLATPPACHTHVTISTPFSASTCDRNFPTSAFFHLLPTSYEGTSAGSSPMLVSGTSPPEYDIATSRRSSPPRRTSPPPPPPRPPIGVSPPPRAVPKKIHTSPPRWAPPPPPAANLRTSRSRKSPESIVPPGN